MIGPWIGGNEPKSNGAQSRFPLDIILSHHNKASGQKPSLGRLFNDPDMVEGPYMSVLLFVNVQVTLQTSTMRNSLMH